jgi:tetratricopeptide (TPR) repeat protein
MEQSTQRGSRRAVARRDVGRSRDPRSAWDRRTGLVAIPLALIVIAAFFPALDNGFVDLDDSENFLYNPSYRGLGLAQLKWAWTTLWVGVYQPLAWWLFGAQYVVWKLDPRGYHLTSLLFHAANAVVLYVLTMTVLVRCRPDPLLQRPWTCALGAGLATALFAVHPLRVETVAWASCQPYLPCALFFMLAVLTYLRAFPSDYPPRRAWLVGAFVLFVAALLSKAVAVSLPAVLLILDVYPLRRFGDGPGRWSGPSVRKAVWEKVPFVLVSLVFMGLALAARPGSRASIEHYDASARLAKACYGIWFYPLKTALPLDLIPLYPSPREMNWRAPPFLWSILGTVAMSVGVFLLRRRWPGLLAAWMSYLVILAPNSGLIWVGDQLAADRYSYVAMLGLVMLAAAGLCRLWPSSWGVRRGAIGMITVSLCALLVLVVLTWHQCRIWHTPETLWTHALNHGGGRSSYAHINLGLVRFRQGKLDEAAAHYREAIRVDPAHAESYYNLGLVLFRQGKLDEAAAQYTEAIRLDPGSPGPHYNLGLVLFRQGKLDEAAAHYTEAIRLDPGSPGPHNNLGAVRFRQGKYAEAAAHYTEAIRLDPDDPKSLNNRAILLATCPEATYRDGTSAVETAIRACALTKWKQPGYLDTLAAAYAEAGDFDAAVRWQTRAIALPRDERENANGDSRSRLVLYRAKTPYREASPGRFPTEAHP